MGASLLFYASADPRALPLLLGSVLANYGFARWIERSDAKSMPLVLGLAANILFLGWFKYAGFFAGIADDLAGTGWTVQRVLIPLGISFFTLQQIAFLVDVSRGQARTYGLLRQAAFVVFFPILVAGPIVRGHETLPQLDSRRLGRFASAGIAIGLMLFAIGLFKKTAIGDSLGLFASPVYSRVAAGEAISFADAWLAAIGFSLQVYFDFSGYSDMAIGAARMFGVRLPLNFHSPLRAPSIIEYWRRWHMTLQRFIVSYIYQPMVLPLARLAGARGLPRWPSFLVVTAVPMIVSFVLVGLWHGAAYTFILFGLMHGIFLAVNEAWRMARKKARKKQPPGPWPIAFYHLLTLIGLAFSNVMFRAQSVPDGLAIWRAMVDFHGVATVVDKLPTGLGGIISSPVPILVLAIFIVAALPNSQQLLRRYRPALDFDRVRALALPAISLTVRITPGWAIFFGLVFFLGFAFITRGETQFIYRNF